MVKKKLVLIAVILLNALASQAQFIKLQKPKFSGMYFQWGYNRDWYSKSDIHLSDANNYDFTIYDVKAKDKPDFEAFKNSPWDITIPQNSYRLGVYLNEKHTHAIEFNYDHAKYVQIDSQDVRLKGRIGDKYYDTDTNLLSYIVHVEHTNGANFYHLNYVGQAEVWHNKKRNSPWATAVWKVGAGVLIPKSFVITLYEKLDNKFIIAGYIASVEVGTRFYPFKNFFLEATAKTGYANYVNALGVGDGRVSHDFTYFEVIGLIGYDMSLGFLRKKKPNPAESKY